MLRLQNLCSAMACISVLRLDELRTVNVFNNNINQKHTTRAWRLTIKILLYVHMVIDPGLKGVLKHTNS